MRSRYQTNHMRALHRLGRLGQDFYDIDYSFGTASEVPLPATSQGSSASWFQYLEPIAQSVKELGTSYLALESQKSINEVNADRLRRGLPPLSQSQIAAMSPRVNVGLAPSERDLLVYGGLAVLGLGAVALFMSGRRR